MNFTTKRACRFFLFLLNFAYDTVKVGECTKGGDAKKKKKRKLQKFYRRQWQLTAT
jgi:hypothetical protein